MELVIDVGNSETVIGIVDPGTLDLRDHWRLSTPVPRTPDEYGLLLRSLLSDGGISRDDITMSVLGSVVPATTRILTDTLERVVGEPPMVVNALSELPIRLDVEEPLTVGADRIVNTLAAKEMYGRDTIAVDLGTATTFDCITADGVFVGGVIAQGLQSGLEWLGRKTAKLPRVELTPPDTVIGRRTETCIQSGVFYSAVDAVDGIVRRILDEWQREDVYVVATGGYAEVVGPQARTVDHIEPFLTLFGLALAGREIRG
jgi:type III pantothenate kinase